MTEQFSNFAQSTLSAAINASQSQISVASAKTFPLSGTFRIVVQSFDSSTGAPVSDHELMIVNSVSANSFNVTRGAEGTTAIAFASGAKVTHIITAGVMQSIISGGGGVSSLNALTGGLSLTSTGGSVTITPSGSTINLEAASGGSGTVTSVSVTTANGISGSVATATTTPAITLTLGAITPSFVNGVSISGSSTPTLAVTGTTAVSGTNTGDQTITLTGDVTGSGTGSFTATIANSAVTLTKMANVATSTVFYRKTAGTGAPEVQTLATLKTDLGLTGTNSGDQTTSGTTNRISVTNGTTNPAIDISTSYVGQGTITTVGTLTGGATGAGFTIALGSSTITGTLAVANGGTAIASYAIGDILYASGATTLSKLADVATGNALISGGVATAPAWGKIGLATHVSGNLPVANLNSGTSASATTFWCGDNTWKTPSGGGGGMTEDFQYFATSGTWTKPAAGKLTRVICIGAGGSGGTGRRGATSTERNGGAGGAPGAVIDLWFPAAELGSTETITVGAGGVAVTQSANDASTSGNTGGNTFFGGTTTANSKVVAVGGKAGSGGGNSTGTVGPTAQSGGTLLSGFLYQFYTSAGGDGGGSSGSGGGGIPAGVSFFGAGGGGGAAHISSGNADSTSSTNRGALGGSTNGAYGAGAGGNNGGAQPTSGTPGASGGNGASPTIPTLGSPVFFGAGGGGGNSNQGGNGGTGGDGGQPGGGGGGGGATLNATGTSTSGKGADGGIIVITYY